jgi:hypothetical protein
MARARASPEQTSWWAADSQIIGSDDTVMIGGSCPRPFKNVIVCATGVLDKVRGFCSKEIENDAIPDAASTI